MATREEIYKLFGPVMIEAVMRIVFAEINVLRSAAGLQERTLQQAIDALENQLATLEKYNWMKEDKQYGKSVERRKPCGN